MPGYSPSQSNDRLSPPYRLLNAEDILAFGEWVRQRKGRVPISRMIEAYETAARQAAMITLRIPPILPALPPRIEVMTTALKNCRSFSRPAAVPLDDGDSVAFLDCLRKDTLEIVDRVGASFVEACRWILARGPGLLSGTTRRKRRGSDREAGPTANGLDLVEESDRMLGELFRLYLDTKEEKTAGFLRDAVVMRVVLGQADAEEAVAELRELQAQSSVLLGLLGDIHIRCLRNHKWHLMRSFGKMHLERLKARTNALDIPPQVKRQFHLLLARFFEDFDEKRILPLLDRHLMAWSHTCGTDACRKLTSYTRAFLARFREIDSFYAARFPTRRLEELVSIHQPQMLKKTNITTKIEEVYALTLYPCKDFHDLLKGFVSSDCTANPPLAETHMTCGPFFNIRIFKHSRWVGNIYVLDLTHLPSGAVVIDRIQAAESMRDSIDAVARELTEAVFRAVRGSTRSPILLPVDGTVSNCRVLEASLQALSRRRPQVPFRMDPTLESFESSGAERYYCP